MLPQQSAEISDAGEAAARILHGLCARTFAYAVRYDDGAWKLRIECATGEGWEAFTLPVDPSELAASLHDRRARRRLATAWSTRLQACGARGLRIDRTVKA